MSNTIQGLIWNIEFPNPIAKMVALKLGDNANDEGGDIYPATTTIAKKCGVARSAVCRWQRAMEHCGLLQVVSRSQGGARTETTERAFDLDMLQKLAPKSRKTPAEMKLIEVKVDIPSKAKDGTDKTVSVPVFKIVPNEPVRETDGSPEAPPVLLEDGSDDATRPPGGHQPSSTGTGTRPPGGHEPFKEEPFKGTTPPTPQTGGWARGWTESSIDAVRHLATSATAGHVASAFIETVRGLLNPPAAVDGPSFVRQLGTKLARFDAEALAAAALLLLDKRARDLPAVPDIEAVAAACAAKICRPPGATDTAPSADADPAIVTESEALRAAIAKRVGKPTFDSWFVGLVAERFDGRMLRVSLPSKMRATWVRQHLERDLIAAAASRFKGIEGVEVVCRGPAGVRAA